MPRIMLTDDSQTMRRAVELSMLGSQHHLTTADSWQSMQPILQNDTPDVFLIDLFLPNVDGLEICSRLQAHHHFRQSGKILLIRRGENVSPDLLSAAGVNTTIEKPFESQTLLNAIDNVLNANQNEAQIFEESAQDHRLSSHAPALPPAPTFDLEQALDSKRKTSAPPPMPSPQNALSAAKEQVEDDLSALSSAFTNPENKALPHRLQVTQTNMRSTKYVNKPDMRQNIPSWLPQVDLPPEEDIPSDTYAAELHEEISADPALPTPVELDTPEPEPPSPVELDTPAPEPEPPPPSPVELAAPEPLPDAPQPNHPQSHTSDLETFKELARQAIEEVAWEVLPDLVAEVVRSELERAKREDK